MLHSKGLWKCSMLQTDKQAWKRSLLDGGKNKTVNQVEKLQREFWNQKHQNKFDWLLHWSCFAVQEGSMLPSLASSQRGEFCVV